MTGDIGEQGTCTTCAYTEGEASMIPTLVQITDIGLRLLQLLDRCHVLQT
jgi:hypothetical protein